MKMVLAALEKENLRQLSVIADKIRETIPTNSLNALYPPVDNLMNLIEEVKMLKMEIENLLEIYAPHLTTDDVLIVVNSQKCNTVQVIHTLCPRALPQRVKTALTAPDKEHWKQLSVIADQIMETIPKNSLNALKPPVDDLMKLTEAVKKFKVEVENLKPLPAKPEDCERIHIK